MICALQSAACAIALLQVTLSASRAWASENGRELLCFTDRPAIVQGERATLRAWVVAADGQAAGGAAEPSWAVSEGLVQPGDYGTEWDLSRFVLGADAVRKVTATATSAGLACTVELFVGRPEGPATDRGSIRGESLISARGFLRPGDVEARGFGLYSYLLLTSPPRSPEERARYLKTIEAVLITLQDVDDYLRRHVAPRGLNATYIPLKRTPQVGRSNAEWAASVLAEYDYAAANVFLAAARQAGRRGPYLISVLQPLSQGMAAARLTEDLAGVVPDQTWNWVAFFAYSAAQERSWTEQSLERFALKLRNLIAVGGRIGPTLVDEVRESIRFDPKV